MHERFMQPSSSIQQRFGDDNQADGQSYSTVFGQTVWPLEHFNFDCGTSSAQLREFNTENDNSFFFEKSAAKKPSQCPALRAWSFAAGTTRVRQTIRRSITSALAISPRRNYTSSFFTWNRVIRAVFFPKKSITPNIRWRDQSFSTKKKFPFLK